MKISAPSLALVLALALSTIVPVAAQERETKTAAPSVTFGDVAYVLRWSKDDQREFTPRGQEDLQRWTDMVTLHRYREVKDGDALAATANAVLENYKRDQAIVLRTDAVPRTADKPAEYLMVVVFPKPEFIEAVFARFKLINGVGTSSIYSHRKYGKGIGDQMSEWLKTNGPTTEKTLMSWEGFPAPDIPMKK